MATEYDRPSERIIERQPAVGSSTLGTILGIVVVAAIGALFYFTFFDRTPSAPRTVTSKPTAIERTAPPTTSPPANTANPAAPSTK